MSEEYLFQYMTEVGSAVREGAGRNSINNNKINMTSPESKKQYRFPKLADRVFFSS